MKKKRGRPKKAAEKKKSEDIHFRVPADVKSRYLEAAAQDDRPLSSWARRALDAAAAEQLGEK